MPNLLYPRQILSTDTVQVVTYAPTDGLNLNSAATANTENPSAAKTTGNFGVDDSLTTVTLAAAASSTADDTAESTDAASSSDDKSESGGGISVGTLVAVCIAVGILMVLLLLVLCWRRKREKRRKEDEQERRMHRQRKSSWGEAKLQLTQEPKPSHWKDFEEPGGPGQALYPPPPDYLLRNTDPYPSTPGPRSGRRVSIKSTVTGKVNPSNNFAVTDENYDDDDDGARSTYTTFSPMKPEFQEPTLTPLTEPGSFLSFHSAMEGMKNHDFLQREAPSAQPVPSPQRSVTTRSQDGKAASKNRKPVPDSAINDLLAALDTSALDVPTKEAIDKRLSRGTSHLPLSDDGHHSNHSNAPNPFQDPSRST